MTARNFKTDKGTELPLLNLRGKEYLEVKYRLVWFREEHPEWSIETELLSVTDVSAYAKATIRDQSGRIIATSHKFESVQGFADFIEKAETGAIGRALALIGFGTQFCADELDEGQRVVDTPVAPFRKNGKAMPQKQIGKIQKTEPDDGSEFVPTFGKYRGQRLNEVDIYDLAGYVAYIEKKAKEDNRPIQGQVAAFMAAANKFIGSRMAKEDSVLDSQEAE